MKELEKTKRISIAAVLTILVVLVGILSFKRPKNMYVVDTKKALTELTADTYIIAQKDVTEGTELIDIRNQYEYEKGHLEGAINIPVTDLLTDESINVFKTKDNIVLYGNTPNDAVTPLILLRQLGYSNVKVLAVKNSYDHNKLITEPATIETAVADIKGFIDNSVKKAEEANAKPVIKEVKPAPVKQVVPVKKKKKLPVEGGC
ncbi:MAG: rhodanese-like domain-containing protein [Flavobacteriaceae bacterium]|nr:rhodanese-like domain-containing protein [Flavobacteriaceae bacterium]